MNNATSISVDLSRAIRVGADDVKSLTFNEPTLADLIAAEEQEGANGQHKITAFLMARMSGLSTVEIGQMSLADYRKCDRKLQPFIMGNGKGEAGETSQS